jgi:hypothetical protein
MKARLTEVLSKYSDLVRNATIASLKGRSLQSTNVEGGVHLRPARFINGSLCSRAGNAAIAVVFEKPY